MADEKNLNQELKRHVPQVIKTTADMMRVLEEEIAAMKNGEISVEVGRVVLRGRGLQLKNVELNIKYNNMLRRGKPFPMEMPLLGEESDEKKRLKAGEQEEKPN